VVTQNEEPLLPPAAVLNQFEDSAALQAAQQ
jgi:hypothetical protein